MMIMSARKAPKKKGHPKFNVPNYGTKNRSRVQARWRKQRGIDNKKREKLAFAGAEPTIGYRNPEAIRGVRANGKRAVLVHNVAEFRNVVSGEEAVDVILAGTVSRKKRLEINKMAQENKVRIVNLGKASRPIEKKAKKEKKEKKEEKKEEKKGDKKEEKKPATETTTVPAVPSTTALAIEPESKEGKQSVNGV